MLFYKYGFRLTCKAKDLTNTLKQLGEADTKVKTLINLHLN